MSESLGERIHRMQVEDRNVTVEQISKATGLGELSVWPYYAGWAFAEIERLRAEWADRWSLDNDIRQRLLENLELEDFTGFTDSDAITILDAVWEAVFKRDAA